MRAGSGRGSQDTDVLDRRWPLKTGHVFLSTGLQSIESQLPAQSRQGSSSGFLGQQWIQFPGGGVGRANGPPWINLVFHLRAQFLLSSSIVCCAFLFTDNALPGGRGGVGRERRLVLEAGHGSRSPLSCPHGKGLREAGSTAAHLRWLRWEAASAAPTTTSRSSGTQSGTDTPIAAPILQRLSSPRPLGSPFYLLRPRQAVLSVVVRAADDHGWSKANHVEWKDHAPEASEGTGRGSTKDVVIVKVVLTHNLSISGKEKKNKNKNKTKCVSVEGCIRTHARWEVTR